LTDRIGYVGEMTLDQITNSHRDSEFAATSFVRAWANSFIDRWVVYAVVLGTGTAVVMLAEFVVGSALLTSGVAMLFLVGGIGVHLAISMQNMKLGQTVLELERRLVAEASSSRVLAGIRLLGGNNSQSSDARFAAAVRMATEYPSSVLFNLREAHGILVPSSWSYDGQLSQIREEFEAIDGDSPGAVAARQGSAIVMSGTAEGGYTALPEWAVQAGFTQGIVAPVTHGLDTTAVMYVLSKSEVLPTLNEIEQLELIIAFQSTGLTAGQDEYSPSNSLPFRIVRNSVTEIRAAAPAPIRMEGFALNPEFERMEMDGVRISLSPIEFLLMHTLASSPDQPVSPIKLIERCWTKDARPADNAIDVAIFRLRKKLNKMGSGKGLIKTVRGNGYMFVPPSVDASSVVVAD
jgi:DNA-binding winged helix-turn-helix (wHTH) protein